MRYFVLSREGLSDDMRAALTRGLGLSLDDVEACERHCLRYGIDDLAVFCEELDEAQAAIATAKLLGVPIQLDWRGQLCYDIPLAPDNGAESEDEAPWKDDAWLANLIDAKTPPQR